MLSSIFNLTINQNIYVKRKEKQPAPAKGKPENGKT